MSHNEKPAPGARRRGPEESNARAGAKASAAPTPEQSGTIDAAAAAAFLRWLRPDGPWTLTAIDPSTEEISTITARSDDVAVSFARLHNGKGRNIYYSVNRTKPKLRKKASKGDIAAAEYVHVDLDPRDDESAEDAKTRHMERLATFDPHPTAVVDSGNGIQALWRLDAPVPSDRFAEVEAASAGVLDALGGDRGTQNVDRILRLPGTRNFPTATKRARGRTECDARVVTLEDTRHPLSAFPAAQRSTPTARPAMNGLSMTPEFAVTVAADHSNGAGIHVDPVDPAQIEAALAAIPSCDRDVWYRVGAALYSAFDGSDEGFAIFDSWSRTTTRGNYSEESARKQWDNSAAFTDIHVGTIFHLASEADPNWRDVVRDDPQPEPEPQPVEAAAPKSSAPQPEKPKTTAAPPRPTSGLVVRALSSYEMEPVRWLWPNRFPLGKLSIIIGDPQEGKSQIAANIEARVTRGGAWPNDEGIAPQGNVLIFAAEDGVADTIRPRFEAAGGDPSKVHVIEAVHIHQRGLRGFDLSTDLERLEAEVRRIGDVRLIRFDPISAYMGAGKIDSHNNTDVRAVLTALSAFADRNRVTVLGISHLPKNSTAKAAVLAIGSVAFSAAARSVYLVVPDTEQSGRRLFLRAKNNLAPANVPGLAYRFEVRQVADDITAPVIKWDSERITITADEAMAAAKGGRSSNQARAAVWLRTVLANGPRSADTVIREGEAAGFTDKILRAAREKVGVITTKGNGKGAGWTWALPEAREPLGQQEMELTEDGHQVP